MGNSLRDFIASREAEIGRQLKALKYELKELKAAKAAIEATNPEDSVEVVARKLTHRDMIISVLKAHPHGGTSDRVIEWIEAEYGVRIAQPSMASQLSRLKSEGFLTNDPSSRIWRSANAADKRNELPKGSSYAGDAATSPDPGETPGIVNSVIPTADPAPRSGREGGD